MNADGFVADEHLPVLREDAVRRQTTQRAFRACSQATLRGARDSREAMLDSANMMQILQTLKGAHRDDLA